MNKLLHINFLTNEIKLKQQQLDVLQLDAGLDIAKENNLIKGETIVGKGTSEFIFDHVKAGDNNKHRVFGRTTKNGKLLLIGYLGSLRIIARGK